MDTIIREIYRAFKTIYEKHNFKYYSFFHALFEHNYTGAPKAQRTLNLEDMDINSRTTESLRLYEKHGIIDWIFSRSKKHRTKKL